MMKNKLFFLLCVNLIILTSCSDDISYEGELNVRFHNSTENVILYIYSIENENIPIYFSDLKGSKEFQIKLDSGNYIISLADSGHYSTKIGFQVRLNSRTSIYYNENNSPSIVEF